MGATALRISRDLAIGARHMVAAKHPWAVRAALDILERGGNAVDAAVATGLALAVTLPRAGNLGGGSIVLRDVKP